MAESSSEGDIWEYKSLKKTKRRDNFKPSRTEQHASKRQKVTRQGRSESDQNLRDSRVSKKNIQISGSYSNSQLPNTSVQSLGVNGSLGSLSHTESVTLHHAASPGDNTEKEEDRQTGGYCPICQMPFSILVVQSQRWHVAECLETPGETNKECPDGLQCSSSIPNHYKRYSHSLLAHSRAVNGTDSSPSALGPTVRSHLERSLNNSAISNKESSADSAVNLSSLSSQSASPSDGFRASPTPVHANALLLLRSPAPEDIKKKKGWSTSPKGQKSQTSSQEPKIRISTPVKAGDVQTAEKKEEPSTSNNDDDYISYSPLSELLPEIGLSQSRKKLFHSTALEYASEKDDDSLLLFNDTVSDDDLLSDIVDQYEPGSQEDSLVMESPNTCDQLDSLDPHDSLMSSRTTGAANGPCQFSSPDRLSKEENILKTSEDSSDKPRLQSSGSLVLDRLRECISNPADLDSLGSLSADLNSETQTTMPATKTQTLSNTARKTQVKASGFKQTDIGVFFGLKPLTKKAEVESNAATVENLQLPTPGKCLGPTGRSAKRQGRQSRKSTGVSGESTTTETAEEGAAQPTQTEGGAGGRKRWHRGRATDGGPKEPRRCPFYKKIPGTGFAVDAFHYETIVGIKAYFLTHFHSDHYGGLTKKSTLPIYCNKITGNLVKSKLKVDEQYVHILPMNTECMVHGVKVILLDANHCPGAAMLLFLLPDGQTVLHTGDFRADPSMERYPELQGLRIQTLYLDTTYCSPEYSFPTQQEVITFAANTAFELVTLNPRTLVVCGTYAVGKEKVFLAISDVLGSKVYMSRDRYNTMCCLESEQICKSITTDQKAARVHVLPMMHLSFKNLRAHLDKFSGTYDQLVAFKPTGWTFTELAGVDNIEPRVQDNISIYGIPYSEHSSYLELKRFVQWLRPLKIIPTVNVGSWRSRKAMEQCFSEWMAEVKALNTVPFKSGSSSNTRQ